MSKLLWVSERALLIGMGREGAGGVFVRVTVVIVVTRGASVVSVVESETCTVRVLWDEVDREVVRGVVRVVWRRGWCG